MLLFLRGFISRTVSGGSTAFLLARPVRTLDGEEVRAFVRLGDLLRGAQLLVHAVERERGQLANVEDRLLPL
jgi:hypothetical protein